MPVHDVLTLPAYLAAMPAPCLGWEARCKLGAAAAHAQGLGSFWPEDACDSGHGGASAGRLSCAFRAAAWASPSLAQPPTQASRNAEILHATDTLEEETLFLFLPGTGTSPNAVRGLLNAAADMGYHVLGLSYASLPTAVSMMNLWCTRPKADAALCNEELHESVLFGSSASTAAASSTSSSTTSSSSAAAASSGAHGLWDLPANQSVAGLATAALRELRWLQFLTDAGGLRWERLVVAGHSQGASHAAYLSTQVPLRGALFLSGPQEVPACSRGWLRNRTQSQTRRRAAYSREEECGDRPAANATYCAAYYPHLLRDNLEAMGLQAGVVGAHSGYTVLDYEPLVPEGSRSFHNAVALEAQAPPAVNAVWKALLDQLGAPPPAPPPEKASKSPQ